MSPFVRAPHSDASMSVDVLPDNLSISSNDGDIKITSPSSTCPTTAPHRVSLTSSSSSLSLCRKRSASQLSSTNELTRFINARILRSDGSLQHGSLTVDQTSGIIVHMDLHVEEPQDQDSDSPTAIVDCQGLILSPGFIDIQINGAFGVDFSNPALSLADLFHVAHKLPSSGVTSFCPTVVSSSQDTYTHLFSLMHMARHKQVDQSATILGMHLEGPFFAPSKRGAHDAQHIATPQEGLAALQRVYGMSPPLPQVEIVTLAPELDGAHYLIQALATTTPHPIVVSCGHTEATFEDGLLALSHGATLLTHLFNAMNPFHHREPGLVGLLSSGENLKARGLERPYYSLIVDGIHVHESAVSLAYKSHPHGCVLVTDAMSAMGLGDGRHSLGSMSVSIHGHCATVSGSDTLAGSVVSMDACVRRLKQFTGCSLGEALVCATWHPARVLQRHVPRVKENRVEAPIGILEVGATANLLLLTDNLEIVSVWIEGRLSFGKV